MRFLALLLLAPWLLVLAWAYASYPKSLPRTPTRRLFDAAALLLALAAAGAAALFGHDMVVPTELDASGLRPSGAIWQQVLPALLGYGAFSAVLALALPLRAVVAPRRGAHRRQMSRPPRTGGA